ncbi:hypothetical protein [Parafrankia sp. Ea1.12]|uniref:hypothetical protein n=1 Tax=Parafrankia sp. Ea1.12 TaxID=573499 RepID=UPI001357959D|nr:hypothetical protein [Parafrankia sp. Ea1.12]
MSTVVTTSRVGDTCRFIGVLCSTEVAMSETSSTRFFGNLDDLAATSRCCE